MDSITTIREALGIQHEAVGVKYTDDVPAGELAAGMMRQAV